MFGKNNEINEKEAKNQYNREYISLVILLIVFNNKLIYWIQFYATIFGKVNLQKGLHYFYTHQWKVYLTYKEKLKKVTPKENNCKLGWPLPVIHHWQPWVIAVIDIHSIFLVYVLTWISRSLNHRIIVIILHFYGHLWLLIRVACSNLGHPSKIPPFTC